MLRNNIKYKMEKMIFIERLKRSNLFKELYLDDLETDVLLYLNDLDDFDDYDGESFSLIKNLFYDFLYFIKNKQ
jgi:hypothetical protein